MKYRSKALMVSTALAAFAFAIPAQAAINCKGTVTDSYVYSDGGVFFRASYAPSWTQICNIKETWKGVDPDVCLTWLAKVDAAVSLERSITVRYMHETSCNTLPAYTETSSPVYVMIS